jgi:hypothetical protein
MLHSASDLDGAVVNTVMNLRVPQKVENFLNDDKSKKKESDSDEQRHFRPNAASLCGTQTRHSFAGT